MRIVLYIALYISIFYTLNKFPQGILFHTELEKT